ncbi:alpha/beta hydrolase [Antrihabitans sp. YC2-6]|uniref:alpha/beta hydrolase n=1 Tax=Antrihabitans sp. YC2-6 TaxID=2799498 RepID=UPI0018F67FC7|nr:alpha/beta fold hydrolase [Antrihabitans sp. YC2-6]MBJ8346212.1 alpha/beta fold hydrolase [Antrihabitans sp. YC2-6]
MRRRLLNAMLYYPTREFLWTPSASGLDFTDLDFVATDGVALHAWWIPTPKPSIGHVLLAHGNAGNIGDRVAHARLLTAAGFDVLLFDYRGFGRSQGRPNEAGTYLDARAARTVLLDQAGVDPGRIFYLGESLGGAVVVELALEHPPAGVVLTSTFTSVRAVAQSQLPVVPRLAVPDAYPTIRRIPQLRSPLLVIHGVQDELVPVEQARQLFAAAPEPKQLHLIDGVGHNDVIAEAGAEWSEAIGTWGYHNPYKK